MKLYREIVVNPYNEEDLKDHHGISAIIYNSKKQILMQDHVKYNFWTIPVGKVKDDQTITEALIEELLEETNIRAQTYKEVFQWEKVYERNKRDVKVVNHLFEVSKWSGVVKNLEDKKHRSLEWMSVDDILKLDSISNVTKVAIEFLKGDLPSLW